MTNGTVGGVAVAAADAMKAIGSVVFVEPNQFISILEKSEKPVVVRSPGGFLTKHKYLTSYKGLVFFTKSSMSLMIPAYVEIIEARKIIIPRM